MENAHTPVNLQGEKDYFSLLKSFAQSFWETDANGNVIGDSASWRNHTGQTAEQWMKGGWMGAVFAADRDDAEKVWQAAIRDKKDVNAEYRIQCADGSWCWTNIRATAILNLDGSVQKWVGLNIDISHKKLAKQALTESEERFRAFVTATSDAVYRMNADWTQMQQLIGKSFLPDTKTANSSWLEQYIPSENHSQVWSAISKAISQKIPFELEHPVVLATGSTGWTFSRAIPIFNEHHDVKEWFGTASDITAQKKSEEIRIQSEKQYRMLFESMQEGYCICKVIRDTAGQVVDCRYVHVNPAMEKLFSLNPGALDGKTAKDVLSGIDSKWFKIVQKVMEDRETVKIEDFIPQLNNWYIQTLFYYSPDHVAVLFDEIGERKRHEIDLAFLAEVSRDLQELTSAESTMNVLGEKIAQHFDLSLCAFVELNPESDFGLVNHSWHRQDVPALSGAYRISDFLSSEFEKMSRAGKMVVVEDTSSDPLTDSEKFAALHIGSFMMVPLIRNGNWLFWLSVFRSQASTWTQEEVVLLREITSRIWDALERANAQHALREAASRKDEFLAMLAHELRNPMSTVRNGLSVLSLTITESNPVAHQTLKLMNRQVDHLVRLVDDLLDVSRITRNKIELKKKPLDLGALIGDVVTAISDQYITAGKQLHLLPIASPLLVDGDATRLSQVLTNLLTNGLRYTGQQGRVSISLLSTAGKALIRVSDNGIGLSSDQLTSVFDLFVQVDNSLARSQGGLGIGLTLVQRLVNLHGGHVEAQSPGLGKGSEFLVYLPLLNEPEKVAIQSVETPDAKKHGRRVLVIDDNVDATVMITMLLKIKGFEVDSRNGGLAGIKAAEESRPAVILCDIGMPELNGYETAKLIRQQPWGTTIPLIALTGYGQREDIEMARAAGFDGHLIKPVDVKELMQLLESLLNKNSL